jgi:hypothetical protein
MDAGIKSGMTDGSFSLVASDAPGASRLLGRTGETK